MRLHWCLTLIIVAVASSSAYADPLPKKISVATWNVEWLFDDFQGDNFSDLAKEQSAPSREEWEWKRDALAAAIAKMHPTIIALQEVESARVAFYLTRRLKQEHKLNYRYAFIQGGDYFTEQDVVVLYQSGLVEYSRREQTAEMFASGDFYNVQKHLIAKFEWGRGDEKERLTIVNFHLRARADAIKFRLRQSRLLRYWMQDQIAAGENVILLGDTNSEVSAGDEKPTDDIGILRGLQTPETTDDLIDLHTHLPADQRQTHLLPGKQFDRILVSRSLQADDAGRRDLVFAKMTNRKDLCVLGSKPDADHWNVKYYDIDQSERDISDHYPIVAEFELK